MLCGFFLCGNVTRISTNDIDGLKPSNDEHIDRRNSYELAKAESNMRRKPFYGDFSERKEESGEKDHSKRAFQPWKFEVIFAGVILSNAILLGIQTEWASRNLSDEEPLVFTILQIIYAMLFVAEIVWRISLAGCQAYLCSADWGWHLLDIFVTLSAVVDVVAMSTNGFGQTVASSSNSGFRLLRVMKIARLVRAIRVVKAWPDFYM